MMAEEMAYVAYHASCGKVIACTIDNPEHKREVAKDVARWIRYGDTVNRVPAAEVPDMPGWCQCWRKKSKEGGMIQEQGS
jgi:hypothetical protein